ncbi:MAG: polynucleotide adenylyltransferase PcnB [Kiritimatiellia bacterium]|nr:polynucleotide adenylyltransferase PcnB [Kiritimatiellia bacterium]MDP6847387.1 polynucleotide adenylyltransferase PcnB [Kiritimatiellia bacterium]
MAASKPIIRKRSDHRVSRKNIDPDALKVLYRLSRHGYIAYLVGGSVRDLLLHRNPKDFDISTDAHPRQIKRLFRNCFLIGRRFRLAHIRFGQKVIETSTFRREPVPMDPAAPATDLYQHQNNTFGTPSEDAHRRDFTVNGLFYDIKTFSVIDHVGGLRDLDKHLIRSIGDPNIRFREDPVRMLRAVRFASRLGFKIESGTYKALLKHHKDITKASAPRLIEDIAKLFAFRSGEKAFRMLRESKLMADLLPELAAYLEESSSDGGELMWACLNALDSLSLPKGEEPNLALRMATLCYAMFQDRLCFLREHQRKVVYADIARDIVGKVAKHLKIPKKIQYEMAGLLASQRRIEDPSLRFSKRKFMSQPIFPNALRLYEIRVAAADGDKSQLGRWLGLYKDFKESGGRSGEDTAHKQRRSGGRRGGRRRRRPPRGPRSQGTGGRASTPRRNQSGGTGHRATSG